MLPISSIPALTHPRRLTNALTQVVALPLVALSLGCRNLEPPTAPDISPAPGVTAAAVSGFGWSSATPESQGMCGSIKQLGCTKSLQQIWTSISNPRHNTKRFIVIRNDKVVYDRGVIKAYPAYSASKGLLGGPTLVYAMSRCGLGLTDPASNWLSHGEGARWNNENPWTNITVEQLATHTSGICDYGNSSSVCRTDPRWQRAFEIAKMGGEKHVYPNDAFTIARVKAEQNREPSVAPGSVFEYSNVGHAVLNYVVQRACGEKLTDIFDTYIKQAGMGSPLGTALISTDEAQHFNQSTGTARWNGLDGAAVLRLAGRQGIWGNQNIEPVRYWDALTKVTGNLAKAAAVGWGVVFENNSKNMWTKTSGHRRLSLETFGHGGNYSTVFINDPLSSTIVVRQGENNANGASYLTINGCAPGWTGTAPTCTPGTDWSNNWNVPPTSLGSSTVGPRIRVVDPLQEAFFFPPPFCRMTGVAGTAVAAKTDVYDSPAEATAIELSAEIQVNPREGAGSSVIDKVEFYKETSGSAAEYIGQGTLVAGTSPAQYRLSYSAGSHGKSNEVRTYFANCVAKSAQDATKKVPSYSRPVRVRRL